MAKQNAANSAKTAAKRLKIPDLSLLSMSQA
jgi:hypothetical protein